MPLRIVRSDTSAGLWGACLENWLSALGDHPGPEPHGVRLWLAHRWQRDAALEAASESGIPGWFDPPLHFLSELRGLFDIRPRPIGVLTGRLLVARLAHDHGGVPGPIKTSAGAGPARSHMLDGLFGELLAEGVSPDDLAAALAALSSDEFTGHRNGWLVDIYRAFLEALEALGLYDARQIHALVAARIEAGALSTAVRGAHSLHVYGLTSLGRRRRLFRALAEQSDVQVTIYLISEPEASEWDELTDDISFLDGAAAPAPRVRSVPDALREASHVARLVKRLIVEERCRPVQIAVVARSGREDTRRVHRALAAAGVPSSARLRTTLAEIPALRALLDLFRAQAAGWDYHGLRTVGVTPYFDLGLDPRPLDFLSSERRISGLDGWRNALDGLRRALEQDTEVRRRGRFPARGIYPAGVAAASGAVEALAERTAGLGESRPEAAWIDFTRSLTAGDAFSFRRRVCRVVGERYDVVRLDQRGVRVLDSLLGEWCELVEADRSSATLSASEWCDRLRRLLAANELALSTPRQEGVQVLEAHEAALTPFRHVFLVHANDGEFPRTPRGGGILADGERRVLRAAGLPLEDRSLALRRERALWRSVTAAPHVTITCRTGTAAGVPLLPSLMVPEQNPGESVPRTLRHEAEDGGAINRPEQLRRDVLRVGRLRRGDDRRTIEVVDVHAVRQAIVAAFADELRSGALDGLADVERTLGLEAAPLLGRDRPVSERAHAWGGLVRDPAVRAAIAARFGPDHAWSPSQLEQYARRPFDFLLSRVLRIEGRAPAEQQTTPLAAGRVIHAVLEELHTRLLEAEPEAFAAGSTSLLAVCDEVFAAIEREAEHWLGVPALWRLERAHLRKILERFTGWDFDQLRKLGARPIAVEVAFGSGEVEPVRLIGRDVRGRRVELRLAGRIDRVDHLPGGAVRIIDYKRKETPDTGGYDDGTVLQPALYMRAWAARTGEMPREALFLSVMRPGKGSQSGLPAERAERVLRFAFSIPGHVRAGRFEPVQCASGRSPFPGQPGREITRTDARITAGSRFEDPATDTADG